MAVATFPSGGGFGPVTLGAATPSQRARAVILAGIDRAKGGHFDDAINAFTRAIELEPKNAEVYKMRAVARGQLAHSIWKGISEADIRQGLKGKERNRVFELRTAALEDLHKALKLNPEDVEAKALQMKFILEGGKDAIEESRFSRGF